MKWLHVVIHPDLNEPEFKFKVDDPHRLLINRLGIGREEAKRRMAKAIQDQVGINLPETSTNYKGMLIPVVDSPEGGLEDVTDLFPSEGNRHPENWLMRATCHCIGLSKLSKAVQERQKTKKYVAVLTINGQRVSVRKFFEFAEEQFEDCVKREAKKLIKEKCVKIDDIVGRLQEAILEKLGIDLGEEEEY